jgi:hypothetical protein
LRANEELLIFDQPSDFMDVLVDILQDSSRLRAFEVRATQAASKFLNQNYVNRVIAEDVARLCQFKFGAE